MKKKILYIEISTAHTEIINSFVEALLPEYEVQLLIHEKSVPRLDYLAEKIQIFPLREETYLQDIFKLKQQSQPDLILLNSAQGRRVRDLCLRLLFDRTPIVGIHHNAENLFKSFTQKIISFKVRKYVVLADFIKKFLEGRLSSKIEVESFYPLSYHHGRRAGFESEEKFILIPGVLEQDRRDYLGFVDIVLQSDAQLDRRIKFVFLGNGQSHDGPQILDKITFLKLNHRFVFFDRYVEDDIMLNYVEECVAIMPLLHPGTRWFEKYFETKISGAYSLAFAFNRYLLMHEVFKGKDEFEYHAVFYNKDSFVAAVESLLQRPLITQPEKFEFSFQKNRLLQFLK